MRKSLTILAAMVVFMAVGTAQADYSVDYTAEINKDGNCVKFEDAMYLVEIIEDPYEEIWEEACLGEDGVVETDTFIVTVDGDVTSIGVAIKAGKCKSDGSIDPAAPAPLDLCGFTIELVDVTDGTYTFEVTSDDVVGGKDGTAALSNVEFCFGDATVLDPEEGPVTVDRISPYEEPTEPEEVDED